MRFEIVEEMNAWVVRCDDVEVARFQTQDAALSDVAQRLRDASPDSGASLSVRYGQKRRAG
jgi:hypothetical protein